MSFSESSFVLKNDGTLWGCGDNDYGQLGLGDTNARTIFTQININADDVKSAYCGRRHTLILKNDGTLWGCGDNGYGQLGLGSVSYKTTFTKIVDNINSVYCGGYHTLILKNDGTLWGCGSNQYGQLGLGDKNNRSIFTQITTNTDNIKSVYCGHYHALILKNDGTLWICGWNDYGQLGLGDTVDRTTFTQITTANISDIKSIYCGHEYTLMLKNNGTLWACGYNTNGVLGFGDTDYRTTFTIIGINTNDIKSVYCGWYYTLILKNDGTLWGCGSNQYGQLGLGDTTYRTTFTLISINTNDIKSVYCGYQYAFILKNDGTLWACGYNAYGRLGLGDTNDRITFTQVTTNVDNIKKFANDYDFPNIIIISKLFDIINICSNLSKCYNIKKFANDYDFPNIIKIYDSKIGYTETLDTNNFRNIPVDKFEKLKVLYIKPLSTILNCIVSFDQKQTWKTFDGLNWSAVSDISESNIVMNCMDIGILNTLNKDKLIAGGFTGDLDFKIAMKTNDKTVTSSVTKIYIEYK